MSGSPQHSVAQILATHLATELDYESPPWTSDANIWPIFYEFEPDAVSVPDNILTIFNTEGIKDGRLMTGTHIWHFGLQLRFRGRTPTLSQTRCLAMSNTVEVIKDAQVLTLGTQNYEICNVSLTSPPFSLGLETGTKRRSIWVLNALVTLKILTPDP